MTTTTYYFASPVTGRCVPVEAAHNPILSTKALGNGAAIFPEDDTVTAPYDGIITAVFDRGVTLLDPKNNIEMLLCADINVSSFVQPKQNVQKGTPLFYCNIPDIRAHGGDAKFFCILTNLLHADISITSGDVICGKSRIMSCECIG